VNPAYLLAAFGSMLFGSADLCGGIAAKRAPAATVTLFSGVAAMAVLVVALPFLSGDARLVGLLWGAAGGAFGGVGALLIYRALAMGPVSVASPVLCVTGLSVPVIAGLALGERPAPLALGGLALAPLSIALLAQSDARWSVEERAQIRRVLPAALAAGAVAGFFLLFMGRVPAGSGLVPLMLARGVGMAVLVGWTLWRNQPLVPNPGARQISLVTGALDSAANIAYVTAVQQGSLALVAALVSLGPATTVLLARLVLHERTTALQRAGLVAALASGVLISFG